MAESSVDALLPSSSSTVLYPKVCRDQQQFLDLAAKLTMANHQPKHRPCAVFNMCCSQATRHAQSGWTTRRTSIRGRTVSDCKTAKTLLKKIDKHRDSVMHIICEG